MQIRAYRELEEKVIRIFKTEGQFEIGGTAYKVRMVDKPRPSFGECKTDVYVLGESTSVKKSIELKISVKTSSSNEFQENKVTLERAEAYFGPDWSSIVQRSCGSIEDRFNKVELVYASGKYPTKPNSITLGWKLEIADKPRNLSAPISLTEQQVRDYVYKGTNLSPDKKNASVNNVLVVNSGVANVMLKAEIAELKTTREIISKLELIDRMKIKPTYLIFTANNYRTDVDKTDGARSLAVRVDWSVAGNKLSRKIIFDKPLLYTGKEWKQNAKDALKQLGKKHPSDMTRADFVDPSIFLL